MGSASSDGGLLDRAARGLDRARYRVWQLVHGFRPHLAPDEVALVRAALSDAELALFVASEPRDRRHAIDLYCLLAHEGERDGRPPSREALVAALVHDTGKGRLHAWHRVLFVLLEALSPALARRIEAEQGAGWRQALWRLRHHARLGAERLRTVGSDPRIIEIVAAHTDSPSGDEEIRRFIETDNRV